MSFPSCGYFEPAGGVGVVAMNEVVISGGENTGVIHQDLGSFEMAI